MNQRQRWTLPVGVAAELIVLAWSFFELDLAIEWVLAVGGALAISLGVVQVVRRGWYGLVVAWLSLMMASEWYFVRYVSEALALSFAITLATLVVAIVSPVYHAVRRGLHPPEETPRSRTEESRR